MSGHCWICGLDQRAGWTATHKFPAHRGCDVPMCAQHWNEARAGTLQVPIGLLGTLTCRHGKWNCKKEACVTEHNEDVCKKVHDV